MAVRSDVVKATQNSFRLAIKLVSAIVYGMYSYLGLYVTLLGGNFIEFGVQSGNASFELPPDNGTGWYLRLLMENGVRRD